MQKQLGPMGSGSHGPEPEDLISYDILAQQLHDAKYKKDRQRILVDNCRERYGSSLQDSSDDKIYGRLTSAYGRARSALRYILGNKLLPLSIVERIAPRTTPNDPIELMTQAFPYRNGLLEPSNSRQQFEARRLLWLGNIFFDIAVEKQKKTITKKFVQGSNKDNLHWITQYLRQRDIFRSWPFRKKLITYHDPKRELLFTGTNFGETPSVARKKGMVAIKHTARRTRIILTDLKESVLVMYSTRRKEPMSMIRKMFATGEPIPEHLPDILAIRMAFLTVHDVLRARYAIISRLPAGCVITHKDRLSRDNNNKNKYSADDYKDISYLIRILDDSGTPQLCELQLMTIENLYNVENSAARINHRRYEVRQLFADDGLFMWLSPTWLYGIPWDDPETRNQIDKYITTCLQKPK